MPTDPRHARVIDAEFEVVDDGTGYGPAGYGADGEPFAARYTQARRTGLGAAGLGGVPAPAVALLARLASGLLRGHEADALAAVAIAGGYARSPASLRATVERYEEGINAFLQEIDLAAVIDDALDPDTGAGPVQLGGAALPLVGVGALAGFVLRGLLTPSSGAASGDDSDDD